MDWLSEVIERLNLAQAGSLVGRHFDQLLQWISILFGACVIILAKKQTKILILICSVIIGSWLGFSIKEIFRGSINTAFFLIIISVLCAFLMTSFKTLVGVIIGGFLAIIAVSFISPDLLTSTSGKEIIFLVSIIVGMLTGAVVPTACIAIAFSLIGATFISYGVVKILFTYFGNYVPISSKILCNLLVFLPVFVVGTIYQLTDKPSGKSKKEDKKANES
ncbi:MAG: hypothetical protein HY606_05005 [Planctomycetes bacterium]|nr:hypothetical protein [Planctomycetota bacterium]